MNFVHPSPTDDFAQWRSKIFEYTFVDVIDIALWRGSPHERWNCLD